MEVLEVDTGLAHVGEQPAERARRVGHDHHDGLVCGRGRAVLAWDAGHTDVAVPDSAVDHLESAAAVAVGELVEGEDHLVQVGSERGQGVADGGGVAGEDLGPEPRVTGGDPGDVTQSLAGEGHGRV
jgi:hypothetical protein